MNTEEFGKEAAGEEIPAEAEEGAQEISETQDMHQLFRIHERRFTEWLRKRVSEQTVKDYLAAIRKVLRSRRITRPLDLSGIEDDKQMRELRNFLNYLSDADIDSPLGYPIAKWKSNLRIKPAGVVEIYPTDEEIVEAYRRCPAECRCIEKSYDNLIVE
ncbi:MAG: hypothetical protein QFX32_03795 [Methanolinea sp.]|nr:hypothetical protein [Methanolinea sp.]